jgi:hypothetical protein
VEDHRSRGGRALRMSSLVFGTEFGTGCSRRRDQPVRVSCGGSWRSCARSGANSSEVCIKSFIDDARETCYLTEYYRRCPLVLVRLGRVTQYVLRELLSSSHRPAGATAVLPQPGLGHGQA